MNYSCYILYYQLYLIRTKKANVYEYIITGYRHKEVAPEELLHILDAINNGSTYFENTGSFVEELTETEKQVLRMLAGGIKRKEIAEQLFMSERTVSNHLQHIFEKLEVSSAVEAVTKSIKLGYLPPQ